MSVPTCLCRLCIFLMIMNVMDISSMTAIELTAIDGKESFNRISFGGGGIVRMVIPLYFYLGLGYLYQNVTTKSEELGWIELSDNNKYSPHSSGYFEFGLQGNIKGFTMRTGFRYNFCENLEFSLGFGWTFARLSKQSKTEKE